MCCKKHIHFLEWGEMMRKHIHFFGTVQGVGFRWHLRDFANQRHLTGWVQNLMDGSVVAELQGSKENIDAVIAQIHQCGHIHIDHMHIQEIPVCSDETQFNVQFSW